MSTSIPANWRNVGHLFRDGVTNHVTPPGQETECPLCQVPYADDESELIVATKSCIRPHVFHAKCLLTWLHIHDNDTCPTCRNQLCRREPETEPVSGWDHASRIVAAKINSDTVGRPSGLSENMARAANTWRAAAEELDRSTDEVDRGRDILRETADEVQCGRDILRVYRETVELLLRSKPIDSAELASAQEVLRQHVSKYSQLRERHEQEAGRHEVRVSRLFAASVAYDDARQEYFRVSNE